jgi:hypothetical protein
LYERYSLFHPSCHHL